MTMKRLEINYSFENRERGYSVFGTRHKPYRSFLRFVDSGVWYHAVKDESPGIRPTRPVKSDLIFDIYLNGKLCCFDGNGEFDGKTAFVPYSQFEQQIYQLFKAQFPAIRGLEELSDKIYSLPELTEYSAQYRASADWLYDIDTDKATEQVVGTTDWMGAAYELLAVRYVHRPTGFAFTNYRFRHIVQPPLTKSQDTLLYDWEE